MTVKIPGMWVENEQFELIPADGEHWHIRIKEGEFIETVISFGKIVANDEDDCLHFDFKVEDTSDDEATIENPKLQVVAGKILESIIFDSLSEDVKK